MTYTTIQLRRGTTAEWTSANPVLALGEMGFDTDTRMSKIGDGSTAWNALQYVAGAGDSTAVDVTNYGATGNGTTDDTAAIHAARNASGPGGVVAFPAGTYLVNNLAANTANQRWELADGAVLKMKTGATNAIYVTADNVTISGGIVDCSNGTAHDGSQHPVRVDGDGCTVRGLTVNDSPLYGIACFDASQISISGCTINDSYYGAIWVQNSIAAPSDIYDISITDNVVNNSGDHSAGIGLYGSSTTQRVNRAVISGNVITVPSGQSDENSGAIGAVNCSDFIVADNVCRGSHIAISAPSAVRGVIADNIVRGFKQIGIEIPGNQDSVTVTGNVLDADGQPAISGVETSGGNIYNVSIAGNTIKNFTATSATMVRFNTGSVINRMTVTGNVLTSAAPGFRGILANGSVNNLVASGNVIDGTTSTATVAGIEFLRAVNGVAITGNQFSNLATAAVFMTAGTAVTQDHIRLMGNSYVSCPTPFLNSGYGDGAAALGSDVGTDVTPIFTSLQIGHNTDTTLTRMSAGKLAVEGVEIPTVSSNSTLTNKVLTSPKVDQLSDTNGKKSLGLTAVTNAVNYATLSNSATGNPIYFEAKGDDSNVNLYIQATGEIRLNPGTYNQVKVGGDPVGTKVAVPASAGASGTPGQWAADSSYIYVCTATNTWRRSALATW